jgi:hypothetical protein
VILAPGGSAGIRVVREGVDERNGVESVAIAHVPDGVKVTADGGAVTVRCQSVGKLLGRGVRRSVVRLAARLAGGDVQAVELVVYQLATYSG